MSEPVEVTNLMANPKPDGIRGWARFGDVEARMTVDGTGVYLRNISGGAGCGIDYALSDLAAGDWCYGFVMASSAYEAGETIALIKTGPTTYGSTVRFAETAGEHAYVGGFTLAAPGCNWLFTTPKAVNGAMSVKRFLLCTKEDWETMRENDVQWFDGDGFLTGGGCLFMSVIHMLLTSLWGWRHERGEAVAAGVRVGKPRLLSDTESDGGDTAVGHDPVRLERVSARIGYTGQHVGQSDRRRTNRGAPLSIPMERASVCGHAGRDRGPARGRTAYRLARPVQPRRAETVHGDAQRRAGDGHHGMRAYACGEHDSRVRRGVVRAMVRADLTSRWEVAA